MKVLITGICGFVGSTLARALKEFDPQIEIVGFDNFSRSGSHVNKDFLNEVGIKILHADQRAVSDLELLPAVDWIVEAAANPSVLAGIDGRASSRQLMDSNLCGTINVLEYAAKHRAGFILLSTSRVYSLETLVSLPLVVSNHAFQLDAAAGDLPASVSSLGLTESFPTTAPISLYGASKLASETLALEYGAAFGFPVWINRCGVLAGARQFGRIDQGLFAFWIHSYFHRRQLEYIGFGGDGYQVRDCLDARDLAPLLLSQMQSPESRAPRIVNVSGGAENSRSLYQLSEWCAGRFGRHQIKNNSETRRFDVPWLVLNSAQADEHWHWRPQTPAETIFEEIAKHAEAHPDWLAMSNQ